ncbi:conserved exported hypothetical protein [Capnocytophaga canis]|uniref:hypothetical protein n=1 Tax=Capnocytophaga canis TaxID=1848903 RepID=UPI00058998E7|nr:hypothetical protein [Capnocytophaga canis]CEN42318.1 conserved exported hypothetical protein [Capnocytophaga canis]
MRKLVLSMIIAFLSAGAYAQTTDCTPDQNKPQIGTTYTYQVTIPTTTGFTGSGKYHWYITKDKDLLNGAKEEQATTKFFSIVNEANHATYNDSENTKNPLKLTWNPDALTSGNSFYLVIKYTETKDNCQSSNMKAIKVKPLNNFKLKVTPVRNEQGDAFVAGQEKVCAADISSAKILDDGKVKYEYGKTTLYYKVEMSGFTGNWKPSITLPDLAGKDYSVARTYESVKWNQGNGTVFTDFAASFDTNGTGRTLACKDNTDKTSFILQVIINNGTYEGLTNETITLATKGNMILADNSLGARDVNDDCSEINDENNNKKASQVILARPEIQAQSGGFIIQIQ